YPAPGPCDQMSNPFFATKDPDSGSGLGLMVCHRIATDHHGMIEVTSREGRGAAFLVRLPLDGARHRSRRRELRCAPYAPAGCTHCVSERGRGRGRRDPPQAPAAPPAPPAALLVAAARRGGVSAGTHAGRGTARRGAPERSE